MLINTLRSFARKRPSLSSFPRCTFAIRKQLLDLSLRDPAHRIIDINNGCIYFQDPANQFSYMKEFLTDARTRGVVVDIRQQYTGGVLYNLEDNIASITPLNHHAAFFSQPLYFRNIYDINQIPLTQSNDEDPIEYEGFKSGQLRAKTSSRDKMMIHDPLIDLCYPIYHGDFKTLQGSRGTGKTKFLFSVMADLLKMNYKVIYFNLNKKECMRLQDLPGDWIAFTESQESPGALFLALKMIKLAEYLVSQGNNVVVVVENIGELLRREATIFQNFGQPIAPFSIVNSLYDLSGKISSDQTTLTTLLTIQENGDEKTSSAYSNSLKHVRSLAHPIKFPLEVRRSQTPQPLSQYINRLYQQKNQIQEKKLFKIPIDSYDYYFFYDSPWWIKSLTKFKASNKYTLALFYRFLEWNIEHDYSSQWQIPAHKAFQNFLQFIDPSMEMFLVADAEKTEQLFEEFLLDSRIKGDFSPFKKDYL